MIPMKSPEIFKKFELIRNEIIYAEKEGEHKGRKHAVSKTITFFTPIQNSRFSDIKRYLYIPL